VRLNATGKLGGTVQKGRRGKKRRLTSKVETEDQYQ
jgi:hypothetical protein